MQDTIEIPLSKKKIILIIIGAIAFVIAGVIFVIYPESLVSNRSRSPEFIRIIGIVSIAFFGLCGAFAVVKVFDKKTGLKIDNKGITDNSSGTSVGLIEWEDIEGFETNNVAGTKFMIIKTDKPDKYIERAGNPLSKQAMKTNLKMYGSPLSIASNALDIKFDDLEEMIIREFEKRR